MRVAVLGSGSAGNCVVVESGEDRVLVDSGFSCRETERRLRQVAVAPDSLRAIVLTHEHQDHCRGAERLARCHDLPIFATRGTLEGCRFASRRGLRLVPVAPGSRFGAGGFEVEAFPVPHDAREPVGLVVEDQSRRRLGVVSDLGSPCSRSAVARLQHLDILVQEANHDLDMLRRGPYSWSLKQRVAGPLGHLSNRQAASGLSEMICAELRFVVLYHLSRTNNLPALAAASASEVLERGGSRARLVVSRQSSPSQWLEV